VVHVAQVVLAGWNNFRSMVSGYELRSATVLQGPVEPVDFAADAAAVADSKAVAAAETTPAAVAPLDVTEATETPRTDDAEGDAA
jgi:hypothetical protein